MVELNPEPEFHQKRSNRSRVMTGDGPMAHFRNREAHASDKSQSRLQSQTNSRSRIWKILKVLLKNKCLNLNKLIFIVQEILSFEKFVKNCQTSKNLALAASWKALGGLRTSISWQN